jgi:hypothetical protein
MTTTIKHAHAAADCLCSGSWLESSRPVASTPTATPPARGASGLILKAEMTFPGVA